MSEPAFTNPEVLTDHTDVICFTSIKRIVTGRDAMSTQIGALLHQVNGISTQTLSIDGKAALNWVMKQGFRCGCWLVEKPETTMKAIIHNLNHGEWRDLMKRSGMLSIMDAQVCSQWYDSLEKDDIPVVNRASILSTFKQPHLNKGEVFQRGVTSVFKGLNQSFRTNSPCGLEARIIIMGLVKFDRWGFGLNHGQQRDRLADLEQMPMILDGKPVPDDHTDVTCRLEDHIHEDWHNSHYEDEMFVIRYFQKGTARIVLKRPGLIDKLNNIIARRQSGSTTNEMRSE